MRIRVESSTWAWEPVTPRGVAAFAVAPTHRVWLVEAIVALLTTATLVWFLNEVWFPTVLKGIRQLPAQGEIRQGKLAWRGDSPVVLAGDRFLALVVDLDHESELGHEADLCVEIGQRNIRFFSLVGYSELVYPPDRVIATTRRDVEPWWGAWKPFILAGAGVATFVALAVLWQVLAVVYCPVAWLVAFFANRALSLAGAWRLASAALMPGALIFVAGIFLYGAGFLDLVRLGLSAALHVTIGWIYVIVAPLFLPLDSEAGKRKANPFAPS